MTNKIPGRQRNPENAAPRGVFEGEQLGCVAQLGHGIHAIAVIKTDDCRGKNAERQEPLKDAGAFAAAGSVQTFREIQRDDHANQTGADALQQPAENQGFVAMRQRDHRNADDKQDAAQRHHFFAAQPVGQHAGKQS